MVGKHTIIKNFNSHAHVERDASWINKIVAKFDFNSHAHVERDEVASQIGLAAVNFNSHAHVERDCTVRSPF